MKEKGDKMTSTGFPEAGDVVECILPRMDEHTSPKKFRYVGTVARTEPPEDGWDAGIIVDYPTLTWKKRKGICIFHEWPNRFLRVVPNGAA
jgi:hypothetical protein